MRYQFKNIVFSIVGSLIGVGLVMADPKLSLYRDALSDLRQNNVEQYTIKKQQLVNFPLYPYLDYHDITKVFTIEDEAAVKAFLQKNKNTNIANKLQRRWLGLLKQHQRWKDIDVLINDGTTGSLQCLDLLAKLKQDIKIDAQKVHAIWLVPKPQSDYCRALLTHWHQQHGLDEDIVWQRFKAAMENREITLAKDIRHYMTATQKKQADQWINVYYQPSLVTQLDLTDTAANRDILVTGLRRMASRNPTVAIKHLQNLEKKYQFSSTQKYRIYSRIAVRYATRQDPRGEQWFAKIPPSEMNLPLREWYMRSAIAQKKWHALIKRYQTLPADDQAKAVWRFWRAYAYEQTKQTVKANKIYRELTQERHYYAILASHKLNQPIKLHHKRPSFTEDELFAVAQNQHIQRAKLLYQMQQIYPARSEWNYALVRLSSKEKYLAAVLAHQWGWHDNAIHTLSQLPDQHDLTIRFPLAHHDKIQNIAKKTNLNPATIFAISRLESTFKANARSPVGAMGIMQLMPKTAQRYTKRLNIKSNSQSYLFHVPTNLLIGSTHFSYLLKHLKGDAVAAIAAYNAGLQNVKRWLRMRSTKDTIIWIEMIPFHETRQYVKRIITYSAIYHQHLDQSFDLTRFIKKF